MVATNHPDGIWVNWAAIILELGREHGYVANLAWNFNSAIVVHKCNTNRKIVLFQIKIAKLSDFTTQHRALKRVDSRLCHFDQLDGLLHQLEEYDYFEGEREEGA